MSKDTTRLHALLSSITKISSDDVVIAHVALCQDCLVKIINDMEGMEFNEKHLRRDCERLRRELDDEMGIMR